MARARTASLTCFPTCQRYIYNYPWEPCLRPQLWKTVVQHSLKVTCSTLPTNPIQMIHSRASQKSHPCLQHNPGSHLLKESSICSLPGWRAYLKKYGYGETVSDSVFVCLDFFKAFSGFMWMYVPCMGTICKWRFLSCLPAPE